MAKYIYGQPKQWVCFNSGIYGVDLFEKEREEYNVDDDNINNISDIENRDFWMHLSANPYAIHILEDNYDKINWKFLSSNCNAIHLLEEYIDYDAEKEWFEDNAMWHRMSPRGEPDYTYSLCWHGLSGNYNATKFLENNPDKIDWEYLSWQSDAISLLENNLDKINWEMLHYNDKTKHLIEENIDKIPQHTIEDYSYNCLAMPFLEKYPEKINWHGLSKNKNAIHLLEQNPDKIDWEMLSLNENGIHLLEQNPDKINWSNLSYNKNAIHILDKNINKIDWNELSYNENAIHLLAKNPDKINWDNLHNNGNVICLLDNISHLIPDLNTNTKYSEFWCNMIEYNNIFEYDYNYMKKRMDFIREDLMKVAFHPKKISYWLDNDFDDF
jgi:hypothetical protein